MSSNLKPVSQGLLFGPRKALAGNPGLPAAEVLEALGDDKAQAASCKLAYAGLFVFVLLLYARPQEMFPDLFGGFPLMKLIAVGTLLAYAAAKISAGERLTLWPMELTLILAIAFLGILFTPFAAAPQDSLNVLLDTFLKVIIIFVLMINLLDSPRRLRSIMQLSVLCGSMLAVFAIISYLRGDFLIQGKRNTGRIAAIVAGMFGNPNDLALSLDLLLPLAVIFAVSSRGWRRALYMLCSALLVAGVVVTFSRGGFIGLVLALGVILWKLSKRNRALAVLGFVVGTGVFLAVMPAGYSGRLTTIFSIDEDLTGSAQARRDLFNRGVQVAGNHLILGVGMGNFHIYSIHEQVAHNSYLEIAAELGAGGLIIYLLLIFAPLRALRRIERKTRKPESATLLKGREGPENQIYYYSVALQAAIIAYLGCTVFGSVQYQWHIYFLVAYSIALRQIYAAQQKRIAVPFMAEFPDEQTARRTQTVGTLWKPHQRAPKSSFDRQSEPVARQGWKNR